MYYEVIFIPQVPIYGENSGHNVTMAEDYSCNSNTVNNINLDYLSNEDKTKLMNIANLQNMIENTKNITANPFVKETRVEPSIRRELSDREKVELELKKWNKTEKKRVNKLLTQLEKEKAEPETLNKNSLKSLSLAFTLDNSKDDDFERVEITEKKQIQEIKIKEDSKLAFKLETTENESEGFICHLCKRKFASAEKLKLHEDLSALHKVTFKHNKIGKFAKIK
jgi:hypothetical protein